MAERQVTQWKPWDPALPEGEYLITGGTWECERLGDMGALDFITFCNWDGVTTYAHDGEDINTYHPKYYLANISEVPNE